MIFLESSLDLISSVQTLIRDWFTLNPTEPLKTAVKVATITGTLVTIATTLATKTVPWLAAKLKTRSVSKHLGPEFTVAGIHRSIRYYIRALCQDLDPAGGEEPRLVFGVQQKLFEALDKALTHPTEYNFIILLADSGMGKTSALINYYARHLRRLRKPFNLSLIPLGIPDADERIAAIKDRAGTVLFLDALDEDTLAIVDHVERLHSILKSTRDFERVLISCRTQFFSKDEEIPRETGKIKLSSRAAGEPAEYYFHKIYLSPFNDDQVSKYLERRYPIWRRGRRKKAQAIVKKIPNLTVRPMLLAHVDDIVQSDRNIEYSYQLYEEMVDAWLTREQGFIEKRDDLRQFSERLAVDVYLNRAARGSERIKKDQLVALAKEWNIPLEDWKLSGRSLLNRDAEGNYKFAHRSIMEYLFIERFLDGEQACLEVEWTDQMVDFYMQILEHDFQRGVRLVLPLLIGSADVDSSHELDQSAGRTLFTIILKETRSTNFQRRDRGLRALGRLCLEILHPDKSMNVVIKIELVDEFRKSNAASNEDQIEVVREEIEIYAAEAEGVPRIKIERKVRHPDFEVLKFSEYLSSPEHIFLTDGFSPVRIELDEKFIGCLKVFCSNDALNSILGERGPLIRSLLSPTELPENSLADSVLTHQAAQVLQAATWISSLEQSLLIKPSHLLLALIEVYPDLFKSVFSISSDRFEFVKDAYYHGFPRPFLQRNRSFEVMPSVASRRQFSDEALKVLSTARSESQRGTHEQIGWHHLLLGLLYDEDSKLVIELKAHGIEYITAKRHFDLRRNKPPSGV